MLFGRRIGGRRIAAEQPARQARGVRQADAAVAEAAVILREQILVGAVVEVDVRRIGEAELHLAHRIGGIGTLAQFDQGLARGDRRPIDARRIDRPGVGAVVRQHVVIMLGDIFDALGRDARRDEALHQIARDIPIRVQGRVIDRAGEQRGRRIGLADDDLHAVRDAAILDHPQGRRGGVDHHVTLLERRFANPRQAGDDPRIGGTAADRQIGISGVAQLRIHRIGSADFRDMGGERGRGRSGGEHLRRGRAARGNPAVAVRHARRRGLDRLSIEHQRRRQDAVGVVTSAARDQRPGLGGEFGSAGKAVQRRAIEHAEEGGRGGGRSLALDPQRRIGAAGVKASDVLRQGRSSLHDLGYFGVCRRQRGLSEPYQCRTSGTGQKLNFHGRNSLKLFGRSTFGRRTLFNQRSINPNPANALGPRGRSGRKGRTPGPRPIHAPI